MLAELTPKPDQVTIAVNTNQMNITELLTEEDIAGTSMMNPAYYEAYREMWIPAGPTWVAEHLKRLTANGIQAHFMLGDVGQLETVERLIRRGVYTGPLILNYVAIGGGLAGMHPADLLEFIRRVPDGAVLTIESLMRNVLPMNTIAIALGLHVRVGIEDTLWGKKGERITSVQQIEQIVRIARELNRDVASCKEARTIYQLGEYWSSADETLSRLGLPPNRKPGQRGFPIHEPLAATLVSQVGSKA
jgi:uncharacterized protein (DUF849 family)